MFLSKMFILNLIMRRQKTRLDCEPFTWQLTETSEKWMSLTLCSGEKGEKTETGVDLKEAKETL